jgi:DNA-binding GntR family transcriptional regulator
MIAASGSGAAFLNGSAGALPSRTEAVLAAIRHAILAGQMRPGQSLVEADLAQRFGVSKTPVREALKTLAGSGLVTMSPYRGAWRQEARQAGGSPAQPGAPRVPSWQREAAEHRAILAAAQAGDAATVQRLLRDHISQFAARNFPATSAPAGNTPAPAGRRPG